LKIQTNFNEHFIFCGAQIGGAQIDLQVLDGNGNVVADAPTYLQINDIKQMYERWTVGETPGQAPASVAVKAVDGVTTAFQYTLPQDTNTPYILLVHGWNLETWEKDRFAESAFKRLYWQGYHGRFGSFRWPTAFDFTGSFSDLIFDPKNFDNSEYAAWQSATGLTNLLSKLNAEYPGQVYLMAHSMGNVVAGEALRLAGANQVANTYVAMQAAISAHCYDPSTVNYATPTPPDRYAQYPTNSGSCYFNGSVGAGTYVNFFNTNDYALSKWLTDQGFKPDAGYGYSSTFDAWYQGSLFSGDPLLFPRDTYQIFSYVDPAWSYALGAQLNVGGVFKVNGVYQQVNLPNVWPPDTSGHSYGDHIWHSAEFRSDYAQSTLFWNKLLQTMGLKN